MGRVHFSMGSFLPSLMGLGLLSLAPSAAQAVERTLGPMDSHRVFRGAEASQELGIKVGTGPASDINGDGIPDLVVLGELDETCAGGSCDTLCIRWGSSADHEGMARVTHDLLEPTSCDVRVHGGAPLYGDGWDPALADLDGDGFGDLIVLDQGGDADTPGGGLRANAGTMTCLRGGPSLPSEFTLAPPDPGIETRMIFGDDASDILGWHLVVGDFNGDGYDDFATSALNADGAGDLLDNVGEAYIVFGSAGFFAGTDLDLAVDPADGLSYTRIFGRDGGRLVGVGAGDLDGDGIDDLFLGDEDRSGPLGDRARAGAAHRFAGRANWLGTYDVTADPQDHTVHGARADDVLGWMQLVTDFDGDGQPEWVIGALGSDGPDEHDNADPDGPPDGLGDRPNCGEVFVLSFAGMPAEVDLAVDAPLTRIRGSEANDYLHVSGTGDLDGDGIGDLVFTGASTPTRDGYLSVLHGRDSPPSEFDLAEGADVHFTGVQRVGMPVAVHDFNADGFDDLLVGAPLAEVGGLAAAGEAHLFLSPVVSDFLIPPTTDCWFKEAGVGFHTCWTRADVAEAVNLYRTDCADPTATDASWCAQPNTAQNPGDPLEDQWIRVTDDDPTSAPVCTLYILTNVVSGAEQSFGTDSSGIRRPPSAPTCP